MLIKKNRLFNPDGIDSPSTMTLINGNTTNIFNLSLQTYSWIPKFYREMMSNFWIPEETNMNSDHFNEMSQSEKESYLRIISYLTFLDSIQTSNTPVISQFITNPAIKTLLAIHAYQEAVHSQSYSFIIESSIPPEYRQITFDFWRSDPVLLNRNKYIAEIYQSFWNTGSIEDFFKVLVADFVLEGIYFYSGFYFFYNLASRGLMLSTKDQIQFIHRDEITHIGLFANMLKEFKKENPDVYNDNFVMELFNEGVKQEIAWGKHSIGNNIVGLSDNIIEDFVNYLASIRLKYLNIETPEKVNPLQHLEIFSAETINKKKNNFETTVTDYQQSSAIDGWTDLKF